MKEPFRMLIGDDSFVDERNADSTILLMLCGMKDAAGYKPPIREGRLENGVYRCNEFPLVQFNGVEITCVSTPEDLVKRSLDRNPTRTKNYDWIVSDLSYGPGLEEAGISAMRQITNPDAIRAIFTSSDFSQRLAKVSSGHGCDYFVATALQSDKFILKSELLGRIIAKHYLSGGKNE